MSSQTERRTGNKWPLFIGSAVISLSVLLVQSTVAEAVPSHWRVVTSANRGTGSNALNAVSCPAASSCYAVGSSVNGSGVSRTLIEAWNGTKWSTVKSPNESSGENVLDGIDCTSATSCVAVGYYVEKVSSESVQLTLVEVLDGGSWSVTPSANPSSASNALSGVFCYSPGNCTAVGYAQEGTGESEGNRALVEVSGNGTWSVESTPDIGRAAEFTAVTCLSNGCIAVGNQVPGNTDEQQALIEDSSGTSWSVETWPNSGSESFLLGVSCPASTACFAVGDWQNGTTAGSRPLTLSGNGSTWSVVQSPSKDSQSILNAISCTSASNCVGAGYSQNVISNDDSTMIESWNGTKWAITGSPNSSAASNLLTGVSCSGTSKCEAVGGTGAGRTLAEEGA
jgi:hypothetical protein